VEGKEKYLELNCINYSPNSILKVFGRNFDFLLPFSNIALFEGPAESLRIAIWCSRLLADAPNKIITL
jgi:hypothetical protein